MRSIRLLALPIVLAFCAVAGRAADEQPSRDDLVREFLKAAPADTTTHAQLLDTNGFHIESSHNKELDGSLKPTGNQFQTLFVSAPGTFTVALEKGRPTSTGGGVAIFHRTSGEPLLFIGDGNGDGQLDGLTYLKVDASGKALVSVTDYEVDGQADFRINFADHYSEIWHIDRWYRVENRSGHRGIILNGTFVELRHEKNRYFAP